MDKFSVDFVELQSKLTAKKAYLLADVKHKIKKVAFDVVRFMDKDNIDELWQIQRQGDDEYIVAMYDDSALEVTKIASTSSWKVVTAGSKLQVMFDNQPLKVISLASLGIPAEDAELVRRNMEKRFASDSEFANIFVQELSEDDQEFVKASSKSGK